MRVTDIREIRRYYRALEERDSRFTGIFFAGVTTTAVFCISICRARKPKPEHVVFFSTARDALLAGFRPCKICKPTENSGDPPDEIKTLLGLVAGQSSMRMSDAQLRIRGYNPDKIRRWFKRHYDMTFQTYQRMVRINSAYRSLKHGANVADSAFRSGYESLSGFGYTFRNLLGAAPKKLGSRNVITIARFTTPIGPMLACASPEGVCLLEFTDRRMLETELKDLSRRLNAVILKGENDHLARLGTELREYFEGSRRKFTVPLHTLGTPFQQSVWNSLMNIPYGETVSYKRHSAMLGKRSAVRAVASANGKNRISIIIPCHRVIGENGDLKGYGGGIERKRWLLAHERLYKSQPESRE